MLVAIILAIASTESVVHPAICDVSAKLFSFSNLSLGSGGSSQNTSNAAPAFLLKDNTVYNSSLLTIAARATFTRYADWGGGAGAGAPGGGGGAAGGGGGSGI